MPYIPFTPPSSTTSTTPPAAFTPPASTPSTTPPGSFFPVQRRFISTADMVAQATVLVAANASEQVMVGTGVSASAWFIYTLTAGAGVTDATHFQPVDYDATLNAKRWTQTSTGVYP